MRQTILNICQAGRRIVQKWCSLHSYACNTCNSAHSIAPRVRLCARANGDDFTCRHEDIRTLRKAEYKKRTVNRGSGAWAGRQRSRYQLQPRLIATGPDSNVSGQTGPTRPPNPFRLRVLLLSRCGYGAKSEHPRHRLRGSACPWHGRQSPPTRWSFALAPPCLAHRSG